jgi:hypothetical protein
MEYLSVANSCDKGEITDEAVDSDRIVDRDNKVIRRKGKDEHNSSKLRPEVALF